jgi:formylglycine-generating enzyme required for sulfatase activity
VSAMKWVFLWVLMGVVEIRVVAEEAAREALVMGVGNYAGASYKGKTIRDLPGITDADLPLMKQKLESLGFRVRMVANPTRKEAEEEVDAFSARIKARPGVSLFYFSGHGGEYKGKNYLIPKEASIGSAADLEDKALNAQRVLNGMEESGASVNLVFLDCCREDLGKNVGGAELAPLKARGSFVGFATRSGDFADPEAKGSPYTRFLLKHLGTPGVSVSDMYANVIGDVKNYSLRVLGEERRPGFYSELDAPFYFVPVSVGKLGGTAEPQALIAERMRLEEERRKWEEERKRFEMAKLTPPKTAVPPPDPVPDAGPLRAVEGAVGKTLDVSLPGGKGMRFCYCPPGNFRMGSPLNEHGRSDDENPVSVTITQGFWMAETEVTQAQWQAVMGSKPSSFKGSSLPVDSVTWNDAMEMVGKLNQVVRLPNGLKFALPTEAQWEYACRAGTQTAYAFANNFPRRDINFDAKQPVGVKSYRPNRWGLYDMHGNVWEWCADRYGDRLQGGVDPEGASSGVSRVNRGGGWNDVAVGCRAAERGANEPGIRFFNLGFRPALVPSK